MTVLTLHEDPDYDPETVDQIDAQVHAIHHLHEAERPDVQWTPSPDDHPLVSRYLRAHRWYRGEADRVRAAAKTERERIDGWERSRLRRAEGALAWIEHMIGLYLAHVGQRKVDLPAGSASWRKGRERVEVPDPEAFCELHGDDSELVCVKREPDKRAILEHAKATGEIPQGADVIRGADTLHVE